MRKIMLVIAAVMAVGFMLPAQLPNPLNLPDPLGLSRPNPDTSSPEPLRQPPRYEEDQQRYKRHYPKKYYKRFHEKRRKHNDN